MILRLWLAVSLSLLVVACAQKQPQQSGGQTAGAINQSALASPEAYATAAPGVTVAAGSIEGTVVGGGAPITKSTVTLWEASADEPKQLVQTQTDDNGHFAMNTDAHSSDSILYVVASGGEPTAHKEAGTNSAIALLSVLGTEPPTRVVINELTTVASVWTAAQFLDGTSIKGSALSLRIAAGNVPNLANVETGGLGSAVQDPLNSTENTTLATLDTLADLVAACITEVEPDACDKFFAAATPPGGRAPTDTLAAESIALHLASQHTFRSAQRVLSATRASKLPGATRTSRPLS